MKKFIFSLAAIMVMVCTALTFVSCGSDDDSSSTDDGTKVSCMIEYVGTYKEGVSDDDKLEVVGILTSMNLAVSQLLGSPFKLNAEMSDGKLVPTKQEQQAAVTAAQGIASISGFESELKSKGTLTELYIVLESSDGKTEYFKSKIF